MSSVLTKGSSASLGRAVDVISIIAMAFAVLAILAPLAGGNGLRITDRPDGTDAMMTVAGEPSSEFDIDLGDPIPTAGDGETQLEADVTVGDPITVTASMLDPTPLQRVVWLLWQISGPVLVIAVAWPIRQIARSTNDGDPFTRDNLRRLWRISALVMGGGVAVGLIANFSRIVILQESAAADLFSTEATLDFSPVIIGLVIAALASIWGIGVAMHDELDATI